jgi:glycosyltransferase involved in cell wall biosynthesis
MIGQILLSIGLPVHNGGKYISDAIESILSQTLTDFELIICDNASSDDTEHICRRYAARDGRIRYYRNASNIGASANFNRCFELGSAKYFKWAAHDDLLEATHLERCVASLEANPDAVLCQSLVRKIDADGNSIGIYDSELIGANARSVARRFDVLVNSTHWSTEIFGVIRRDALARTALIGPYYASDGVLTAELGLLGRLIQVPEPLFLNRDHPDRCVRTVYHDRRLAHKWYQPDGQKPRLRDLCPFWRIYAEYWRMVRRHVPGRRQRLRCYGHLLRWPFVRWHCVQMLLEPIAAYDPRIMNVALNIKRQLFGARRVALLGRSGERLEHRLPSAGPADSARKCRSQVGRSGGSAWACSRRHSAAGLGSARSYLSYEIRDGRPSSTGRCKVLATLSKLLQSKGRGRLRHNG